MMAPNTSFASPLAPENAMKASIDPCAGTPASSRQRSKLAALTAGDLAPAALGGQAVTATRDHAPGNGESLGGSKVVVHDCWFAARPSGTESIRKLYAETFGGEGLLAPVQADGRTLIASVFAAE